MGLGSSWQAWSWLKCTECMEQRISPLQSDPNEVDSSLCALDYVSMLEEVYQQFSPYLTASRKFCHHLKVGSCVVVRNINPEVEECISWPHPYHLLRGLS